MSRLGEWMVGGVQLVGIGGWVDRGAKGMGGETVDMSECEWVQRRNSAVAGKESILFVPSCGRLSLFVAFVWLEKS